MQAMLLAAGFGTRLKPYTLSRPKPLFPVLNRPLLHRALDQLAAAGCERIIVNAHHLAPQIAAAVDAWAAARPGPGPRLHLQTEAEILGTGGGLREALPRLADEPLLVVNGDIFHEIDLAALRKTHQAGGNAVTLALHDLPRFNTVHVAEDRVTGFGKAADAPRPEETVLAFTGAQVVNPEIIARIPAGRFFHIIDLYQEMARSGNPEDAVGFVRVDGAFWRDMGTPDDYMLLHRELLSPGEWRVEPTARVAEGARFSGWGCVGADAAIAADAVLENCVVWDGARVPAGTCRNRILTGNPDIDEA